MKSPSQREVVELNGVGSRVTKTIQTAQVVSGAETGEDNKIADQVRLIEITLLQRQLCPVNHRKEVHFPENTLKSLDSHKQFGFNTHLEIEHIDESTLAKSDLSRNVSDARGIAPKIVQRRQYSRMKFRPGDQT